ncbi:acetoacetate decarboxylase family protein [Actinoplanes sp. N902-109]|uniref:acetoacetate decarboxylase family protein n=1 Tax=Actinoplanes sp. (strain N902-109) TaxID=649831 RepID=UPI0005A122C4|nr:acetoacetate decarboxylase family protein [Actinoplanes sp. N902-109]
MYPPAPWYLRGQLYLSVFLVPVRDLPALPPGLRAPAVGGRVPVGAAWVDYQPGGTLHYRELLAAVLVRRGLGVHASITHIWVDSPASRAGGRALWAIPKELSTLHIAPPRAVADGIAGATIGVGRKLPGRLPAPLSIAQAGVTTPVRGTAALRAARITWRIPPDGPLGWLAGRRPVASVTLADFRLRFG